MWNSREHVQAQSPLDSFSTDTTSTISSTASIVADSVRRLALFPRSPEPSSSRATDDLVGAFDRLGFTSAPDMTDEDIDTFGCMSFADPHQTIASPDIETSSYPDLDASPSPDLDTSSPIDMPLSDPIQYPVDSPPISSRIRMPLPPRDKRENNVLTTRALKILTDVENSMQNCATKLNSLPTESIRRDVENTVSKSRQSVENVTRSTLSINTLKEKVAGHILHVENRLIELDTLQPLEVKTSPVEYPNGESSITTQRSSI
ncbi:hypothetical protein PILCRDRAFT_16498 [Piloderma croceum F 1598]|uniref:Biogenesis of lysosome-related organelles complex 1 subunit KXD1 n=1 Tax=Piloderma croceum (strain F 1598) TaxID=765440 RepID=A0A0C3AE25_PILCF|nr:hypothetical protein PILCRDRAFT_16498 [Piloderma croceum F 1598]